MKRWHLLLLSLLGLTVAAIANSCHDRQMDILGVGPNDPRRFPIDLFWLIELASTVSLISLMLGFARHITRRPRN